MEKTCPMVGIVDPRVWEVPSLEAVNGFAYY
jgi:hypothetical protein